MEENSDLRSRIHDHVALDEFDTYVTLLVAAAAVHRRLTTEELDNALGVHPEPLPSGLSTEVRAGSAAERRAQSRAPSLFQQDIAPVSPTQVYRLAFRQAAAEEPSHDVRAGLERLRRWMTQEPES
ncbi:hypothetical protein ACIBG8_08830 [Nonomuraea sp. NPDC050556]|uniref:hypothetical protein n=1 Tax=Nonomuraea sp. NPDC050556 TaxID=3364369 RepID=UPI00379D8433